MHLSILVIGQTYDVISTKSDSAIWKDSLKVSHLKVSQGGCADVTSCYKTRDCHF